jgi:hypothetical protein
MAGMRDGRVSPCFFLVLLLFTESLCSSSSSSSSSSALSSSLEHLALVYKPLLSPELLLSLDSNNNKKEHLEENRRMMLRDLEAAAKVGNNQKENALQFTRRQSFAAHPNATSTFCDASGAPQPRTAICLVGKASTIARPDIRHGLMSRLLAGWGDPNAKVFAVLVPDAGKTDEETRTMRASVERMLNRTTVALKWCDGMHTASCPDSHLVKQLKQHEICLQMITDYESREWEAASAGRRRERGLLAKVRTKNKPLPAHHKRFAVRPQPRGVSSPSPQLNATTVPRPKGSERWLFDSVIRIRP